MKPKLLLLGIILIAYSCGGSNDTENENKPTETTDKKEIPVNKASTSSDAKHMFDTKAAKIIFKYTGSGPFAGTETLYFDDYGNTAVLLTDKGSGLSRNNSTSIWKDNKTTLINHETKKVSTSPFRVKHSEAAAIADISEASRKGIGYEKLPDETIAEKNCEVWYNQKMNIKYWLWKKIDLKLENQGVYTKEATSVEEISSIPSDVMEIPEGYQ